MHPWLWHLCHDLNSQQNPNPKNLSCWERDSNLVWDPTQGYNRRETSMVAAANLGVVLVLLLVFLCFLQNSDAIWLSLPASGTKCISEEIQSNVVVLADYVVISDDHVHSTPAISAKVRVSSVPQSYYANVCEKVIEFYLRNYFCSI